MLTMMNEMVRGKAVGIQTFVRWIRLYTQRVYTVQVDKILTIMSNINDIMNIRHICLPHLDGSEFTERTVTAFGFVDIHLFTKNG